MGLLRAAVIGLGVGNRHIAGYRKNGRCRVVALCDINEATLAEAGARNPDCRLTTNPMEIMDDPDIDVVSIASYDDAHCKQVTTAIANGKHVFIEKPLCLSENEFVAIVKALAAHPSTRLSSNLILRRAPRFMELRRRIAAGEMGDVYYMEGDYDYGRLHKILEGWRADIPFYSVVHGGAIHLIDLLLWLTGGHIEKVVAYGNQIATEGSKFRHRDLAVALLKFTDGKIAKISANFASIAPHHHKLSVYGTKAAFEQAHVGTAYFHSRDPGTKPESVTDPYPGAAKGDMLPSFIAHILDGSAPDVTTREVLDAMAVSLAVEKSLNTELPESVRYASDAAQLGRANQ
jgi:predicted dehydrogenase